MNRAFQHDIETLREEFSRFASLYEQDQIDYVLYYSGVSDPIAADVWKFVAAKAMFDASQLDLFPDEAAAVMWRAGSFDEKQFVELCSRSAAMLVSHRPLLISRGLAFQASPTHHDWIRFIHATASEDPLLSPLVNRLLEVSPRPFDETLDERRPAWELDDEPDSAVANKAEQEFIETLKKSGRPVPEIWFEYIPGDVVEFHAHVLATLLTTPLTEPKPRFDLERREFWFGTSLIKIFKQGPRTNQEVVLASFEESGWPGRIDDPLPPKPGQTSKRRLADTIDALKNTHVTPGMITFRGDGTGEGVIWEFA